MREQQEQQQGEGGEGGEQQQSISSLLDNQKEVISATWNLRRRLEDDESLTEDIQTVLDSQGELMNLLEQASSMLQDTESGGQAYQANEAMQAAAEDLSEALDADAAEEIARALSDAIPTNRPRCSICRNFARMNFRYHASRHGSSNNSRVGATAIVHSASSINSTCRTRKTTMSWRAKPSVNNSRHSNRANVPSNCRRSTASRNFPAVNPT